MKKFLFGSLIIFLALGVCTTNNILAQSNNYQLFTNGSIYVDADHKVKNLLVEDGIVSAYDVEQAKYPNASIIDLKGAAAYPGFCDSHAHLLESGLVFYVGANLFGCKNSDDMVKVLEDMVKKIPENGIIVGGGITLQDYDKWSLSDLVKIDKVTGNRLVFLGDSIGHNAIINTATMNMLGITPKTEVPLGGKIIIEDGKLTGMLREKAMNVAGNKIFSMLSDEDAKTGTLMILKNWASMGYTGAIDLMGAVGFRIMRPEVFTELEKEGTLPLRINYCYTISNLSDVNDAVKYIGHDTDLVRFNGCKIFVDGAYAGGQAWTSWTNKQDGHGLQEIYTDDTGGPELNLNRIVAKVEEYGMNMHYHTQGDMAIKAVLDALDKVVAEKGQLKGIHTLAHVAFPTDEEIERIKKFNGRVVVTMQPAFWAVESYSDYYYGEKNDLAYPVKKLMDSGISVGISTDFAVSPPEYSPTAVVIGIAATGAGKPIAHQPVSVKDMIKGFSEGSAKSTGKDDTGTLSIGKKADIVIFDQDLYSVPPEKFNKDNPKVLATYVSGRKMYEMQMPSQKREEKI